MKNTEAFLTPYRPTGAGATDVLRSLPRLATHVQGVGLNHAIFASEEVIVSPLGVQDGQPCPCKDSHVTARMLTTSCRVSGDHPLLTLFANLLLPLVSPPWHMGWDTALFVGKYSMCTQAP